MTTIVGPFSHWPLRRWLAALIGGAIAALVMGVPTGIVETSFYTRMTPVRWWDYPIWVLAAVLVGLSVATYVRVPSVAPAATDPARPGRTLGASLLSIFAIGCPVCNKLVVAVLGFSGALTYFQPIQPLLGIASLALLVVGLRIRLRGEVACPVVG